MNRERITYTTENVEMPAFDREKAKSWLISVAKAHGYDIGRLSYVFCDDETILRVNREFLGHDYFTDIITFDYTRGEVVSGDMYISLDTVRKRRYGWNDLLQRILQGSGAWPAAPVRHK